MASGVLLLLASALAAAAAEKPAVHESPDGLLSWRAKDPYVSVRAKRGGRETGRARLPPLSESATERRVLFGATGRYFCVVDEQHDEVGLHLKTARATRAPRAVLVASKLTFMDSGGRILWTKPLRDKNVVGDRAPGRTLRISPEGTLAILLQDEAPYTHARPLLLAYDKRGVERLRLDYADWRTIEEFVISDDGVYLAARGFGRIEELETWGPAVALYRSGTPERWVHAVPEGRSTSLRAIAPGGWACCVRAGAGLTALGPKGARQELRPEDALKRFGGTP